MAVQKSVRFIYLGRFNQTGLTDVKAQVYLNGVAKATGASAIAATELGFGVYEVVLTAANLATWGVTPTNLNALEVVVDSALAPNRAIFHVDATVANLDDIDAHLTSNDTAVAAVKGDTAAIKVDLETGPNALSVLNTKLDKIAANSGFAINIPAQMFKPASGSNSYRIFETLYNDVSEALQDADGNTITVQVVNQAGADRSSYLVGYVAGTGGANGSAPMVRDSQGQYHIDIGIPNTAAQEELRFNFAYSIGGVSTARAGVSQIVTAAEAQGFALQSTLLDVQTRTTDVQSKVNDATIGLAAANTLQAAIKAKTDLLADSSIGLSAIKASVQSTLQEIQTNVEGTGFATATDSLHAISLFLQNLSASGGKAV